MALVIKRTRGRRVGDRWTAHAKILREVLQIVLGAVTAVYGIYIGQKSNDPAIETHNMTQRIEEGQRLRAENESLRAQIAKGRK